MKHTIDPKLLNSFYNTLMEMFENECGKDLLFPSKLMHSYKVMDEVIDNAKIKIEQMQGTFKRYYEDEKEFMFLTDTYVEVIVQFKNDEGVIRFEAQNCVDGYMDPIPDFDDVVITIEGNDPNTRKELSNWMLMFVTKYKAA